ncbi:transcriptional regulator, histidine utilization repressor, GntR family [Desulfocicer vacuolatum DSM 3385]|uniref:Histidine utilization repressor n=2 Tax=Desulfocicer vacuolatum TaxID=2298 RepID=A0A1W2CAF6_9BACT|nr:transcriptional regulator, histidine utilization repressor, GntR family [Desulfocicer vacuolatum DSM 3385]
MKIDSENSLVKTMGVSRMTVNRALRELTAEGKLVRLQGVGTFVARHKPQTELLRIRSIAREIIERGGEHSCDIHLLQQEKISPKVASDMKLRLNMPVYHAILVHRDNGVPIQLEDRYINPVVAPDFLKQDFTRITPSDYLQAICPAMEVEHVIEAMMPDKWSRELLEISRAEPCLILHRRTWINSTVATQNRFIYPGSRHKIGSRFYPSCAT